MHKAIPLIALALAGVMLIQLPNASHAGERRTFLAKADPARNGLGHIEELEFKDTRVRDAIRVISELTGINITATSEAGSRTFTLFLRNIQVADAIDSIARVAGIWYRHNSETDIYTVMTTEEYFKDIIVFREERTRVFTTRYQNVVTIARTIEAMFGTDRVEADLQPDFDDDLEVPGATLDSTGGVSGTGGSRRTSRDNRRFDRTSRRVGNDTGRVARRGADPKEDIGELTTGQIAMLERAQAGPNDQSLVVSEETLASVRNRNNVPIFVSINREHNLLFVRTADEQAMEEVERIVRESDRPTPQVLLEMKVMSIELGDDTFRSSFDFSYTGGGDSTGPRDGQAPNALNPSAATGPNALLGLVGAGLKDTSSLVFQVMNEHVRARLQLLDSEGRVNILATPMLLASNNRPAKIFIGEQTVLTTGFSQQFTGTGGGNNTFVGTPVPVTEVVEVGNTLTILPSINADRTVLMRLLQEASTVNPNGGQIPVVGNGIVTNVPIDTIDTSTIEGTAMAKDGLTVMIGGMITRSSSDVVKKVPLLGDLPVMGALFRDTERTDNKRELVLLITPHVFTTPEEAEAVSRQRVDTLTEHPHALDIYLHELDRSRARAGPPQGGGKGAAGGTRAAARGGSGDAGARPRRAGPGVRRGRVVTGLP
ncbi:MAG: type II secretory pathway, component PulD [Gammaproteobacteria bacterium]|nr:type II secretory pathway, component PulD [Gammaproteobacteria bacterium]